jgi:hypothetical protein
LLVGIVGGVVATLLRRPGGAAGETNAENEPTVPMPSDRAA